MQAIALSSMTVTLAWIVKLFRSQLIFCYGRSLFLSYGEGTAFLLHQSPFSGKLDSRRIVC